MNLLIIDDNKTIREGIYEFLVASDYKVYLAETAEEGLKIFNEYKIHLIVLDIMLPGMSGINMLKEIRKTSLVPVIMLTALNDEQTQIELFDEYADDYLSKPFSLMILKKRIEAQIRRYYTNQSMWNYNKASVDFKGFLAFYDDVPVNLTTKEFQLLELLLENKGMILTRSQILDHIWDLEESPFERVIDVYIKNLRQKLKLDCIVTVKGMGYKLEI